MLKNKRIPQFEEEGNVDLEALLTSAECEKAIRAMRFVDWAKDNWPWGEHVLSNRLDPLVKIIIYYKGEYPSDTAPELIKALWRVYDMAHGKVCFDVVPE